MSGSESPARSLKIGRRCRILLVTGAAVITAIDSVVVGLLPFLSQRKSAQDELSNIARQVDIIAKLSHPDGCVGSLLSVG
ncbi:hypothetical protein [Mycobacterium sp. OTB74]|uniref:hypothetical protein n=1 Tax=Mycobacterium sp. OTB74 TaxID=1853452 RepID=UPI00247530A5|nr:hypothetical protein [Mycobacterium sp. OTB74]